MAEDCGCTILDGSGNPVRWASAGLAMAQQEIKNNGWDNNRLSLENSLSITNHFKKGPPSFQDDEIVRTYSMDMLSPYIKAPLFAGTHANSSKGFAPGSCFSPEEVTGIVSEDSHTACAPRAFKAVVSGREEFSGLAHYIKIEDDPQCILDYRGKDKGVFKEYLMQMVRTYPRMAMKVKEYNEFVIMANNGWNVSETGANDLDYQIGFIPSIPQAVASISSLMMFDDHLRGNDFYANKVWHAHPRILRSIALHRQFNGSAGFIVQSQNYLGPQVPMYKVGDVVSMDGVSIKVVDMPFGYIKKTGTNGWTFIPIDPRKFKAVNSGWRAYGDSAFQRPRWTDANGVVHDLVSPIWAADPEAYLDCPIGFDASTPVADGKDAWSIASNVRFIGDAYLPCNEERTKFKPVLTQAWKFSPVQPRATGIHWSLLPSYERTANRIGLDDFDKVAQTPIEVHPGCEVTGLTCAEKAICNAASAAGAELPGVVGVLETECELNMQSGVGRTLTIRVKRGVPPGSRADGAVTLNWATAAGTSTAGVGYTTANGVMSWADEECGWKSFTVAILNTSLPSTQFTVNYSGVTPAPSSAILLPAGTCLATVIKFDPLDEE